MRAGLAPVIIFGIRSLERLLPANVLYWTLKPFALAPPTEQTSVPDYFQGMKPGGKRPRVNPHSPMNNAIEFLAGRFASPKWRRRCQMNGLGVLQQAGKERRPVVLAFVHLGPCFLLPCWLRSAGVPLTPLRVGKAETRSALNRMKDRLSPFPDIPAVLYLDQLRAVVEVLSAGNVLLIALDHPTGKQIDVPLENGWTFRMAAGAVRLAARYQADLIPCCIIEERGWQFRIEIGRPVPREYLAGKPDMVRAGKHLLTELLPHIQQHPDQCRPVFFQCFHHSVAEVSPETSRA